MNRQQRRELLKSGKGEQLIAAYAQDARKEAVLHTTQFTFEYFRTQLSLALHDEFGFGKGRIQRIIKRMDGYSESDHIGDVSYEELRQFVKQTLDLDFRDGNLLGDMEDTHEQRTN